jgi:hypothetical protein
MQDDDQSFTLGEYVHVQNGILKSSTVVLVSFSCVKSNIMLFKKEKL